MADKQKRVRLIPCPAYDVEGMESWLSDMAKAGWQLSIDGIFGCLATFQAAAPQATVYRLEASMKSTSIWAEDAGAPDPEAVALGEKYGWEYVAQRGNFYVYRAKGPGVRALNTDPAVQALAAEEVRKRQRGALFRTVFWLLLWPLITLRGRLLLSMIRCSWLFLLTAVILNWFTLNSLGEYLHYGHLKKRLLSGAGLEHGKNWRKSAAGYFIRTGILILLCLIWLGAALTGWSASVLGEDQTPLAEYGGDPPFVTIAELAGEGAEDYTPEMPALCYVQSWQDPLAPDNWHWQECASVRRADGTELEGFWEVDYHRVAAPWLARLLAGEYRWGDWKEAQPLPCPDTGADFAAAYIDGLHIPTVVLQKGNMVLHASFHQYQSADGMEFAQWVTLLASSVGIGQE